VVESLQRDMVLLCVTGVEDKLQDGVRQTLELLRYGWQLASVFRIRICKFSGLSNPEIWLAAPFPSPVRA
jgi:hypothetical protein